jgi:transposase
VLVRNPEQAKRDRAQREKLIARLEEELEQLKHLDAGKHPKAVCTLRSHPTYGRYLRETKMGQLCIDRAKVKDEERLDGKYLLRTSDDTLTAVDVALGYKQLVEIESAFRTLKTTLELRPVYHRLDERIRAHVVLCWLALLLVRVAELRTGKTWPVIRDRLQRMHLGEFIVGNSKLLRRTETTDEQASILDAMRVCEPPTIFHKDLSEANTT